MRTTMTEEQLIESIKAELRKRHDAGQKTGDDRLNLDALEYIEKLEAKPKIGKISIKLFCDCLYFLFLVLGICAAYYGNLPVALFFAITCAGESIGKSIDYWPNLQAKE